MPKKQTINKEILKRIEENAPTLNCSLNRMYFLTQEHTVDLFADTKYNPDHKGFDGSFDTKTFVSKAYNEYFNCCFDTESVREALNNVPNTESARLEGNSVVEFIALPIYLAEAISSDHIIWAWISKTEVRFLEGNLLNLIIDYPECYGGSDLDDMSLIDDLDEALHLPQKNGYSIEEISTHLPTIPNVRKGWVLKIEPWSPKYATQLYVAPESYSIIDHEFEGKWKSYTGSVAAYVFVFNENEAVEICEELNQKIKEVTFVPYAAGSINLDAAIEIPVYIKKLNKTFHLYVTYMLVNLMDQENAKDLLFHDEADDLTLIDDLDESIRWVDYL